VSVKHECCRNASLYLKAQKLPGRDAYRWRMVSVIVLFCPWCGLELEVSRRAIGGKV